MIAIWDGDKGAMAGRAWASSGEPGFGSHAGVEWTVAIIYEFGLEAGQDWMMLQGRGKGTRILLCVFEECPSPLWPWGNNRLLYLHRHRENSRGHGNASFENGVLT